MYSKIQLTKSPLHLLTKLAHWFTGITSWVHTWITPSFNYIIRKDIIHKIFIIHHTINFLSHDLRPFYFVFCGSYLKIRPVSFQWVKNEYLNFGLNYSISYIKSKEIWSNNFQYPHHLLLFSSKEQIISPKFPSFRVLYCQKI